MMSKAREIMKEYAAASLGISDEETFSMLYQEYVRTFDENFEKLTNSFKELDWDALRKASHALKGCSANLGYEIVRIICLEGEHAAILKDSNSIRQMLETLQTIKATL